MKSNEAFPSRYLKAADLSNGPEVAAIKQLTWEDVGRDKENKPVLLFQDDAIKPIVLNKTNWLEIEALYGDSDDWPGNEIEVYQTKVPFGGELREAIRMRPPKNFAQGFLDGEDAKPKAKPEAKPETKSTAQAPVELEDEVPFAPVRDLP